MKKLNFLSITFILIIFISFIWVLITQGLITLKIVKFNKTDNWKIVEATNDKIYDKIMSLEVGIENRVNNYFPMYNDINNFYYNSIINIDSLYLKDIYLKNNRDDEKVFYNTDNYYFIVNKYSNQMLDKKMNSQLDYYKL